MGLREVIVSTRMQRNNARAGRVTHHYIRTVRTPAPLCLLVAILGATACDDRATGMTESGDNTAGAPTTDDEGSDTAGGDEATGTTTGGEDTGSAADEDTGSESGTSPGDGETGEESPPVCIQAPGCEVQFEDPGSRGLIGGVVEETFGDRPSFAFRMANAAVECGREHRDCGPTPCPTFNSMDLTVEGPLVVGEHALDLLEADIQAGWPSVCDLFGLGNAQWGTLRIDQITDSCVIGAFTSADPAFPSGNFALPRCGG